eukprot:3322875-Amphidinium_carterae.1
MTRVTRSPQSAALTWADATSNSLGWGVASHQAPCMSSVGGSTFGGPGGAPCARCRLAHWDTFP